MTLYQAVEIWNSNAGGIMVFIIILFSIIQITPIKLNPLGWVGKALNKETIDKLDELSKEHKETRAELREHIAQSYRDKIFDFQDELLIGMLHTHEQWKEVLDACSFYEDYVDKNDLTNGKAIQAIQFIRSTYQTCLANRNFVNIPTMN